MAAVPRRRLVIHLFLLVALFAFPVAATRRKPRSPARSPIRRAACCPASRSPPCTKRPATLRSRHRRARGVSHARAHRELPVHGARWPASPMRHAPGVPVAVGQTVTINLQLAPSGLAGIGDGHRRGAAPRRHHARASAPTSRRRRWRSCRSTAATGRTWRCWRSATASTRSAPTRSPPKAAGTYQVNVDGQQVTYWGGGLGNVQPRFSRDAIAEFEFIANRFDATQGRSQGIQINAVTKGGTNNYQGTVRRLLPRRQPERRRQHRQPRAAVLESAAQRDARRPDHAGQVPLLRQLRVRARAVDARCSRRRIPQFNLEFTEPAQGAQVGPAARLPVHAELPRDGPRRACGRTTSSSTRAFSATSTNHPSFLVQTYRDSDQIQLDADAGARQQGRQRVQDGIRRDSGTANRRGSRGRTIRPRAPTASRTARPIITFNGFRFGPPGSVPQEIQQGKLSFRNDFTISVNKAGRHDLKIGGEYIKNSWWLMICRDCTGIYDAQGGAAAGELRSNSSRPGTIRIPGT